MGTVGLVGLFSFHATCAWKAVNTRNIVCFEALPRKKIVCLKDKYQYDGIPTLSFYLSSFSVTTFFHNFTM